MLEYFKYFVFAYLGFYVLLHVALRGKVTIGFISWMHLINVNINLKALKISIGSVSMQIRPMYYLHRKKLRATQHDGLIVVHFYSLKLFLLDTEEDAQALKTPQKQKRSSPTSETDPAIAEKKRMQSIQKGLRILKWLRYILPLTVVIHNLSVARNDVSINLETLSASFNCDMETNKQTKQRELRNSMHFSISNLSDVNRKIIRDLKWTLIGDTPIAADSSPHFTRFVSSCFGHGITINLDELKQLAKSLKPKRSNKVNPKTSVKESVKSDSNDTTAKPNRSLETYFNKFYNSEVYFALDELRMVSGDTRVYMKNLVYALNSADKKDMVYKKYSSSKLYKLTINFSGLNVHTKLLKNSRVKIEFLNFFSIWDLKSILFSIENIHNSEVIMKFTHDDSFIARSFLTITNTTVFTDLEDILKFKEMKKLKSLLRKKEAAKNELRPNGAITAGEKDNNSSVVLDNFIRLTHKLRTRGQFLTSMFQVHLSDTIISQFLIDDILIDSSLTDNLASLFEMDNYLTPTKSIFVAIRNIQFSVVENAVVYKLLVMDLFDASCSIAVNDDAVMVDTISLYTHHIEFLAEDIYIFKKLALIANKVVNRKPTATATEIKALEASVAELSLQNETEQGEFQKTEEPRKCSLFPKFIRSFKFLIHRITLTACFKTPVKFYDGEDQTAINNFKRGITFSFLEFHLIHDNTVEIPTSDIKLSDFNISLIRDYDNEKHPQNFPRILSLQNTHIKYTYLNNRLSLVFPMLDITVSVEVLWTVFFVMTVLTSLKGRKEGVVVENSEKTVKIPKKKSAYPLHILVAFPLIMINLRLPSDVELAFEIDSLQYTVLPSAAKYQNVRVKVFRIYGQNPHAIGFWTLLAIVSNGNFKIIPKALLAEGEEEISVTCDDIRIEIPYEYIFYKTFDNLKAFFKSIKKLKKNFHDLMFIEDTEKDFKVDVIMPSIVKTPLKFPKVRVHSKRILYCNHDDPFEEEITAYLMLARMEQQVRLSKLRAFEKYEVKMLQNLEDKYKDLLKFENGIAVMPSSLRTGAQDSIPSPTKPLGMKKSFSTSILAPDQLNGKKEGSVTIARSRLANEVLTEECEAWLSYQREYHTSIEIPKNRLNVNISKSWISRVRTAKRMKKFAAETNGGIKADPKVRKEFLKKFPVAVEGNCRPLFGFNVIDAIVYLDQPEFGLENYPDFMHRVAGGMPRDMKYGILVPMNLKLWCSELSVQIKDYPLPLVGFGGGKGDDSNSVQFAGDMVICEQKYSLDEIRYNFVPCVPQYNDVRMKDTLYAFHIARTMTNVKFVTDMHCLVDSSRAAAVSWAPSLQPGMSYAFDSFDLLSKPPLDVSPKIGFWDKMPLLVPSKWTFVLKNGIALFIKASQSPYQLIGRNAGFAFKWDKDVKISVNSKDKPEEFLIVESQVFEIGVPVFDPEYVASVLSNGMGTPLDFKIAKVILRLTSTPIVWKLGFLFERNLNNEKHAKPGSVERTKVFRPHYDIHLRNPDTFLTDEERESWDSYEGWRSDYIYLAVSLYSRDDNKCKELPKATAGSAFNSLYLTPITLFYFFFWWDSFKSSLGLPIKAGNMFKNKFLTSSKSPKFGASIFGLTYTVDLSPLYLTHVYQHSSSGHNGSKVAFTGLKCFVKSFTMDLHQCRREVVIVDDKSKTAIKEYRLQMDKGVVDFVDADLRILTAVFNQTSATGMLVNQLGLEKSSTTFKDDSSSSTSGEYMDRVWYDHNDFVELETQPVPDEEPKWKVHEFASTPRFYYVRDTGSVQLDFPFDEIETQTHVCQLRNRDFSHAASQLADARIDELEDLITFQKSEMEDLKSKPTNKFVEKTLESLEGDLQELHHRLHVLRCLKDKFSEGVFPEYDEFLDDQEESDDEIKYELSKVTSRVSSHISRTKSRLSTAPIQNSNYINRFSIYTINIKWTMQSKSGFLRYLEKIKDRSFLMFSMSQQALSLAKALQKSAEQFVEEEPDLSFLRSDPRVEFEKSKNLMDDFDQVLHDTADIEAAETEDSFLLKLILPQIAISTNNEKCVLLTSNQIVLRSVTVSGYQADSTGEITLPMENRNGLIFTDAFLYVLDRENIFNNKHSFFNAKTFLWPPKLPIEMYYTPVSLDECVVVQDISCALLFVKPNELHYTTNDKNKNVRRKESVRIIAPEVNVTTDSVQLGVLKEVFTSIFENDQTEIHKIKESVKNFIKYSDFSDFSVLYEDLKDLQNEARQLLECRRLMMNFNYLSDIDAMDNIESINIELEKIFLNLNAIVDILQTSKAKKYNELHEFTQWCVMAPVINLQLVDENKTPFVEISAVDSYYMFTDSSNGESTNTAYAYDFAVFDKHPKASYETVLARLGDSSDALFRMDWTLLAPVGGIKIVEQKSFTFAPLRVEFDMRFADALQEFIFPKSKALQSAKVFNDSDSDELFEDIDSLSSDGTSIQRVDSVSSVSTTEKQGSKISRAFHKLLPKHSSKNESSSFLSSNSSTEDGTVSFSSNSNSIKKRGETKSENLVIMDKRAATYYMAKLVKIDQMKLSITFRGAGKLRIINLSDFFIEIPTIEVRNKMMSNEELFAIMRNKIVHYVLRNAHNVIKSTLKTSKSSKGASSNPLINPVLRMRERASKSKEDGHIHRESDDSTRRKVHGHKHHADGSKFHDTDLLEPTIGNGDTSRPPKKLISLGDLVKQDNRTNDSLDESAIYQSLDDVQEEDEDNGGA